MRYGEADVRYRKWVGIWAAVVLAASVSAKYSSAQTEHMNGYELQDFNVLRAGQLVDVCTVAADHPDHQTAMAFCYGFIEGGIHYDRALESSPDYVRIVCEPDDTTREQVVEAFVTYLKANPQHAGEMPIDAVFRALADKWPCS